MRFALKAVFRIAIPLCVLSVIPVLLMACLLLVVAETAQGRMFAGALMMGMPAPILLWIPAACGLRKRLYHSLAVVGLGLRACLLAEEDHYLLLSSRQKFGTIVSTWLNRE